MQKGLPDMEAPTISLGTQLPKGGPQALFISVLPPFILVFSLLVGIFHAEIFYSCSSLDATASGPILAVS